MLYLHAGTPQGPVISLLPESFIVEQALRSLLRTAVLTPRITFWTVSKEILETVGVRRRRGTNVRVGKPPRGVRQNLKQPEKTNTLNVGQSWACYHRVFSSPVRLTASPDAPVA